MAEPEEGADDDRTLSFASQELHEVPIAAITSQRDTLRLLDLQRNRLDELPVALFCLEQLCSLTHLNVSRNNLKRLPPEIGQLSALVELIALSNNIRPTGLPVPELAALPELRVLDLQWNSKLNGPAVVQRLAEGLPPSITLRLTPKPTKQKEGETGFQGLQPRKQSAGDRDATKIRSQLEPISTPQLRLRLKQTFGIATDVETDGRSTVMQLLVDCYEEAPREVRCERGGPVREELLNEVLSAVRDTPWPSTTRERPKVCASGYMILQHPQTPGLNPESQKARLEEAKRERHQRVWDIALKVVGEMAPEFATKFTALAVTKNFTGSPHIDTLNVGPFCAVAVGEFSEGGGAICVECSATVVAQVDTRGRFAMLDGRFPHWVTPYEGERYSLIFYQTSGEVTPQTTAIFEPASHSEESDQPWVSPEQFSLC